MLALPTVSPIIEKTSRGRTNYYLRCNPDQLYALEACSTFTIVYTPVDGEPWEAVDYRVIEPRKAYAVINRRGLLEIEARFFENMRRFSSLKRHYEMVADQMPHRERLIVPANESEIPPENRVA